MFINIIYNYEVIMVLYWKIYLFNKHYMQGTVLSDEDLRWKVQTSIFSLMTFYLVNYIIQYPCHFWVERWKNSTLALQ